MSAVPVMLQLLVNEADFEAFTKSGMMVIPHIPAEREGFLMAMARVEKCVEASGDAEAIRAFQWLGSLLARAHYVGAPDVVARNPNRRFDA